MKEKIKEVTIKVIPVPGSEPSSYQKWRNKQRAIKDIKHKLGVE